MALSPKKPQSVRELSSQSLPTEFARAARLSSQSGVPRGVYKGFGTVFQKDGLISSPLEERARLTYAVSQEIEAMLMEIDGVLGVRANVVLPERRYGRNTDLPSAAVLIRHRSGLETDLLQMKVRRLVASSVPGLVDADPRQINISFMPAISDETPVEQTHQKEEEKVQAAASCWFCWDKA